MEGNPMTSYLPKAVLGFNTMLENRMATPYRGCARVLSPSKNISPSGTIEIFLQVAQLEGELRLPARRPSLMMDLARAG
jgi:hypothetical protein